MLLFLLFALISPAALAAVDASITASLAAGLVDAASISLGVFLIIFTIYLYLYYRKAVTSDPELIDDDELLDGVYWYSDTEQDSHNESFEQALVDDATDNGIAFDRHGGMI